jgi:hypothetical protein
MTATFNMLTPWFLGAVGFDLRQVSTLLGEMSLPRREHFFTSATIRSAPGTSAAGCDDSGLAPALLARAMGAQDVFRAREDEFTHEFITNL